MADNKKNTNESTPKAFDFTFGKINYILLIAGIIFLGIGYICLAGGGSSDPNTFNPAMFDGRRLFVAPILITLGLVIEIVAIMVKSPKGEQNNDQQQ